MSLQYPPPPHSSFKSFSTVEILQLWSAVLTHICSTFLSCMLMEVELQEVVLKSEVLQTVNHGFNGSSV